MARNIYIISQDENIEMEIPTEAVVIAESSEKAQQIHPGLEGMWGEEDGTWDEGNNKTWASHKNNVHVLLIGQTIEDSETCVIMRNR